MDVCRGRVGVATLGAVGGQDGKPYQAGAGLVTCPLVSLGIIFISPLAMVYEFDWLAGC